MSQRRQKPIRTTELLDPYPVHGSTSKPSRISRIAQPIRSSNTYKRSLDRAASCDRLSAVNKNYLQIPTSTCKPKRSASATPQRTPNKIIPYQSNILLTVEKAPVHDKKQLQIESNRINEYLWNIENILGNEFFERGGIKTMSTKQFISITQYFLRKICGSRLTIGNNYVDSIANILTKIQYPYTINKSWLKTPCAPHAFNNVVLLFNWFISFDNTTTIDEIEKKFVISGDMFPDQKYTIKFLKQTRDTFTLWNNGSEYDHLQKELKNELIKKRIQLKNIEDIDEDINRLNFEIDEIISNKEENDNQYCKNEKEFYKLDNEIKLITRKINKLDNNCLDNEKILKHLRLDVEEQQILIKDYEKRLQELQKKLSIQKFNITKRNEFIKEVNELNCELQTRLKSVNDLQIITNKNQIILSRLLRKKNDLITNLNTYMYKIFSEINSVGNFNIEEYNLEKEFNINDIENVTKLLINLQDNIIKNIQNSEHEIKEFENQLSILSYTYTTILIPKLDMTKIKMQNYHENIKKIDVKLINCKEKFNNEKPSELNTKLTHLKLSESKKIEELAFKKNELEKIKTKNETIWLKVSTKLEQILKYRENRAEKLNDLTDNFNKIIDEIRSSLKNI